MSRRWLRVVVAPLVLPHELGHALPAALAGLSWEVSLLPDRESSGVVLGQFDAALDAGTPLWLVRLVAAAPLPVFLVFGALTRLVALSRPLAVAAVVFCAAGASLSGGDVAVAANPAAAREAGRFEVRVAGWEAAAADGLTVATTLAVAGLVLL